MKKSKYLISIIVPTYKRVEILRHFIASIERSIEKFKNSVVELIIVDDDIDGENLYLSNSINIIYTKTEGDLFWTECVKRGVEKVNKKSDLIIIANDDIILINDLQSMVIEIEKIEDSKVMYHPIAIGEESKKNTVVGYRKLSKSIHLATKLKKMKDGEPDFLITRFLVTNIKPDELLNYFPVGIPQYHADLIITNSAKKSGVTLIIGDSKIAVNEDFTSKYPHRFDVLGKIKSLSDIKSRNYWSANVNFYKILYDKYYKLNLFFWIMKLCIK